MGEPRGIGPEIIVKALADPQLRNNGTRFVIFGMNELLIHAADLAGIEPYWSRIQRSVWKSTPGGIPDFSRRVLVIDDDRYPQAGLRGGHETNPPGPSKAGGIASLGFIRDALEATALADDHPHRVDAIVTAPICKASWHLAGMNRFPGHTEMFADFAKTKRHAMMFVATQPLLRVVLATIHQPLLDIGQTLTIGKVFDPIDLANDACINHFGIRKPRIAVCGLNPHASEGGLFGDEEQRIITPAIEQARHVGIDAQGPFPADTIYNAALEGKFDIVIAMYHDQGTIPIKLLARDVAVNTTLGLPFIRTSPDHGTAFDIAGKNKAQPGSIKAAIKLAIHMTEKQYIQSRTLE